MADASCNRSSAMGLEVCSPVPLGTDTPAYSADKKKTPYPEVVVSCLFVTPALRGALVHSGTLSATLPTGAVPGNEIPGIEITKGNNYPYRVQDSARSSNRLARMTTGRSIMLPSKATAPAPAAAEASNAASSRRARSSSVAEAPYSSLMIGT